MRARGVGGLSGIAGVVLAAGASRRLGRSKQLEILAGETLLARAVRVAIEAGLEPVYCVVEKCVLGKPYDVSSRPAQPVPCTLLVNDGAAEGMAASIRLGVSAAIERKAGGVILMACDQPAVTAEHLRKLMQAGTEVVASGYASRRGVPAYFPASAFDGLLKLRGDVGARELLQRAKCIELQGGELDVDTPEELQRARELFGRTDLSKTAD